MDIPAKDIRGVEAGSLGMGSEVHGNMECPASIPRWGLMDAWVFRGLGVRWGWVEEGLKRRSWLFFGLHQYQGGGYVFTVWKLLKQILFKPRWGLMHAWVLQGVERGGGRAE